MTRGVSMTHVRHRRKRSTRNDTTSVLLVFVLVFGVGVVIHKAWTGNWTLPGMKDRSSLSAVPTKEVSKPSMQEQAPTQTPTQIPLTGPIDQDIPTHIVVRRGSSVLMDSPISGAYTPSGAIVDPPGDNPYWLSVSSKLGDRMTIPAVVIGHTMNGNTSMPFTVLSEVQSGDLIDLTVPTGIITFQSDIPQNPEKELMGFGKEADTVKLITCEPIDNRNVVVSGHRVSSQKTA